jgi:hypothetical protein
VHALKTYRLLPPGPIRSILVLHRAVESAQIYYIDPALRIRVKEAICMFREKGPEVRRDSPGKYRPAVQNHTKFYSKGWRCLSIRAVSVGIATEELRGLTMIGCAGVIQYW